MGSSRTASQPHATDAAINLQDMTFAWGEGAPLLDITNLQISRGERVFLHGPSGSGKSTLLGLLGGVLSPGGGRLDVLGRDLSSIGGRACDRFRADNLGIIFQMFNLLPYGSVTDNVLLPLSFSTDRRARASKSGSAVDEAARILSDLGLDRALFSGPSAALSVGQQQRVAAARALIGAPELIVADEPTSALDEAHQQRFLDLLFSQVEEARTTLLMVSHDRRIAPLFDRVIELEEVVSVRGRQ